METFQAIILLIIFAVITALMSKRIWPALLAMPVLAVMISLTGGIHINDIFKYVIGEGSLMLTEPIVISMFGGVLSILMQRTGIAEGFIKKGAELSGDNPMRIALLMFIFIMILFTTLGGLGAMIMVGSIVLPILTSVGISRLTASVIMLMGVNIGGMLNAGNWSLYINSLGLTQAEVQRFVVIMIGITFVGTLIYLSLQLYRDGFDISFKRTLLTIFSIFMFIAVVGAGIYGWNHFNLYQKFSYILDPVSDILLKILLALIVILFIHAIFRAHKYRAKKENPMHWTAIFAPILPLFFILVFKINFIAAFILGIIYAYLITYKKDNIHTLLKSLIEGSSIVLPAVVLMFGIGWILIAVKGPNTMTEEYMLANYGTTVWPVRDLMIPIVKQIIPTTGIGYVITFTILAPLALYRGPLNVWGMGFGIASVLLAAGMPGGAILGMLWSVGQLQGICDPTNLQNVWIANEMKTDVQKILYNTLPFAWVYALLGLIAASFIYF